ncbi:efflux RND transporter periplasmic adaptor subunit [bacterium SCSIO 12643]|nr:efflux RND transporter periplasmic adaptor subunit [bacterium SCSIO 12643]
MKNLNYKKLIGYLVLIALGFGIAKITSNSDKSQKETHELHQHADQNETYTCAMHPQIRKNEPGDCPICGMELIPVKNETNQDNPAAIKMSSSAMKLAEIQTQKIATKKPTKELRLNGKVQPDERYVFSQTSHIGGRIEKLLISYTGEFVRKGQVIAYVYSPELVTAQEELIEAHKIRSHQPELYEASRVKLKNWKLSDAQIDGILKSGNVTEEFPIHSDISGVVVLKRVNVGDHIMQGHSLYEVADLSKVWVMIDVYEKDLPWVKVGDWVQFTIQSLPGEQFSGKISFIDPVIHPKTRVARARIEMPNTDERLKPEMFVSGIIESKLNDEPEAIVVPKSAVMWTGKRSVVYVKMKNASEIQFVLRQVVVGPELGDGYVILSGLESGEEIAIHGTFAIDAAAQLAGKPSMMSPEMGSKSHKEHHMEM